ncbi:hypothetical protein K435DRAFT_847328 [Dendrothele bispora CBS 962.96]|uniref:Alpha/beta-hydrolase n=1 Tax=Dendrothele bispora (strain CBS 962.96) TaxID=1314807 RepID=A0A4S8MYE5_DENBC|nr:hypothetical protein K435DRAFT_847328 [Dendrothele bispora CBS 962.96]
MAQDPAETPYAPPSRRSFSYYLVLLVLVAPLWCFVPLSWVWVIYVLRSGWIWSFSWPARLCFAVSLCEVIFSVYHYHLVRYVSNSVRHAHVNFSELQSAFHRVLKAGLADLPEDGYDEETLNVSRPGSPEETIVKLEADDHRAIEFRNTLRTWFGKVQWSVVRKHEVRQWLYWSIFNTDLPPLSELSESHRTVLDDTMQLLEKRLGQEIPEGSCPDARPMRLSVDPVHILWRPFVLYASVAVANFYLKNWHWKKRGFQSGSYENLEYIIRIPHGWDSTHGSRPLVILHGLGLGLLQYHTFFRQVHKEFKDRPILIVLQPHISQDIFHPRFLQPMSRRETSKRLAHLIHALGWSRYLEQDGSESEEEKRDSETDRLSGNGVTLLSHSNGSYAHAWMLKDFPHLVTRSCFVDPVTFCSWEGDIARNFLYKTPTTGPELVVRYFVGSELGIANLMHKHFDWSSNALWYEDIPNARDPSKTIFLLGGKDGLLHTERVLKYLHSHGVRKGIWCDPEGLHGQALLTGGEGMKTILEWL